MATLHVSGRFPHFYVIVSKSLRLQASTRIRIRCVFKSFHSGERFQTFAVTVCVFAGYVWTKAGSVTKYLRIQTNPNTCGQGLSINSVMNYYKCKILIGLSTMDYHIVHSDKNKTTRWRKACLARVCTEIRKNRTSQEPERLQNRV